MDYDYWLRILQSYKIEYINKYLAAFRVHTTSITGGTSHKHLQEDLRIAKLYAPKPIYFLHYLLNNSATQIFRNFYKRGNE